MTDADKIRALRERFDDNYTIEGTWFNDTRWTTGTIVRVTDWGVNGGTGCVPHPAILVMVDPSDRHLNFAVFAWHPESNAPYYVWVDAIEATEQAPIPVKDEPEEKGMNPLGGIQRRFNMTDPASAPGFKRKVR